MFHKVQCGQRIAEENSGAFTENIPFVCMICRGLKVKWPELSPYPMQLLCVLI